MKEALSEEEAHRAIKESVSVSSIHQEVDIMSIMKNVQSRSATQVPEPPIARFLFADTRIAWLWLIVRLYVGWQWLVAGIEKLTGYSIDIGSFGQHTGNSWIFTSHPGAALSGFLNG